MAQTETRAPPRKALETSWLRVSGPLDERTCAWCRRWVGQDMPQELGSTFQREHARAGGAAACRCHLETERIEPDGEDPDTAWA